MVGFAQTTAGNSRFEPLGFESQRELFILPESPYKSLYKYFISENIHPTTIQKIENARQYVDWFWGQLIVHPEHFSKEDEKNGAIKLPAPYLMPMPKGGLHARFFYWDSWFTSMPHIGTERDYIAIGAVENCAYLFGKYNIIPNQADIRFLHRSQPPLLTSMIMDIYSALAKRAHNDANMMKENKKWLKKYITVAKKEYKVVWTSEKSNMQDEKNNYNHRRYDFTLLSNWGDRDIGSHHPSEYESGKDTTSEFAGRAGDFLPVDLNCFLLKYEQDFAKAANILGDTQEQHLWKTKAKERIVEMNKYMWDEDAGYFYNYDVSSEKQDSFKTLSGYQALWCGLATKEQAKRMIKNLHWFETDHGLMTTALESAPPAYEDINLQKLQEAGIPERYFETVRNMLLPGQWTAPNIWSPTQMMALLGFLNYGFIQDTKRIIKNSLISLAEYFDTYHTMPEKRNGHTGLGGGDHTYPDKNGFGWTNAEFAMGLKILQSLVSHPYEDNSFIPTQDYSYTISFQII